MLTKKYVKSRNVAKVTFTVPSSELPEGTQVDSLAVVGNFNNWDETADLLTKDKQGNYKVTVELEPGQSYLYRYLINGDQWYNDWAADEYQPNDAGTDNCVVHTPNGSE